MTEQYVVSGLGEEQKAPAWMGKFPLVEIVTLSR